jgi:hypothetical protein
MAAVDSLKEALDLFSSITERDPIVFVAGSATSIFYPALLPTAKDMVVTTQECLAPSIVVKEEREALEKILPEIYYEILAEVLGHHVLDVWKVLTFWQQNEGPLAPFNLGSNSIHLTLIYLAWRCKMPIITPNYDTFFEHAAFKLNLKPEVYGPTDDPQRASQENAVAIWKVHGDIGNGDTSSLYSTLRMITRSNPKILNHIRELVTDDLTRFCFIGYSGRDIDLFPYFASWDLKKPIFWIDRQYSTDHMSFRAEEALQNKSLPVFQRIKADMKEMVYLYIDGLKNEDNKIDMIRECIKREFEEIDGESKAAKLYKVLSSNHIRQILSGIQENDPRRILIYSMALKSVGQNAYSIYAIDQFLDQLPIKDENVNRLSCRALLVKASLEHEYCHYEESRRYAEMAKYYAGYHHLTALKAQAIMEIDEALRMEHYARLQYYDYIHMLYPNFWITLFKFIWHSYILYCEFWQDEDNHTNYDNMNTAFTYAEHLIRLGAIIQQGLAYIPLLKNISVSIMTHWWTNILQRCLRIGYAKGTANTQKYGERIGIRPEELQVISANLLYGMLGDMTGQAIAERDKGERFIQKMHTSTDDEEIKNLLTDAVKAYNEAIMYSKLIHDSLLELKVHIKLRHIDNRYRVERERLCYLLSEIQGAATRRMAKRLITWLAK